MNRALICLFLVVSFAPLSAWKNPRKSDTLNTPVFGTHDWIAFKGFVLAGRPAFIKNNLNRFFIGTEAPDNGFKPANAEGGYDDARLCHCILFDEDGNVTRDRGELRVRQEFDKALGALADGKPALAAFYAGALAHYMGDLGPVLPHHGERVALGVRRSKAPQRLRSRCRENDSVPDSHFNPI